ncbi:MAG: hypothetical protein Q9M43_14910 [Sulfurimonas sp.]|nr:hypothetical protein [Sulfurimonas sp.]
MNKINIDKAIDAFIRPTVFTGVKPLLLVAEELVTQKKLGDIVEAVWFSIDSTEAFTYISKFAVKGKIFLKKYYTQDEMQAFRGRVALAQKANLEKLVQHRSLLQEIKELKSKRSALLDEVNRGFDSVLDLYLQREELYLFKKSDAALEKDFFTSFDIDDPYKVIEISPQLEFQLRHPKTAKIYKYSSSEQFYGYFHGSLAEITGLRLKSQSYFKNIESLQDDAKTMMKSIDWLDLEDSRIQNILKTLPQYPFEEYFKYVKKEDVRKLNVPEETVNKLKNLILKHMPENDTPLGMHYILIDKLLYLFHAIIPRTEALKALESCDIIYEPPAMILGFEGSHHSAPKYLVPISHVVNAYQQFPAFVDACENTTD